MDIDTNQGNGSGHPGKPPGRYCIKKVAMCARCHAEGVPYIEQDLEFGATDWGFQIWCRRHNRNVLHANLTGLTVPWNID